MTSRVLELIYARYNNGYTRKNLLFRLHRLIIQSRGVAHLLFGIKVNRSEHTDDLFDMTTLLLRAELRKRLRGIVNPRLLEIGVGHFALLSGCLSRKIPGTITASDFNPAAVKSAREHVASNKLDIEVLQSDVLTDIPVRKYDLIFWNLPYYDDPEAILSKLFTAAPEYMTESAQLIIGFNSYPLPVETIIDIHSRYPGLALKTVKRYRWNNHALLVFGRV